MPQSPFKITKHGLVGNLTGSVEGTASCALTASYVSGAVMSETVKGIEKMTSASYAEITPDPDKVYIITDKSASVETASYSVHADSASNAISSSYALTASFCENAGGSEVVVSASLDDGIKIAEITVDGTGSSIYIPSESYATEEYVEAQGVTEPEMDIIFGYSRDSVELNPIDDATVEDENYISINFIS